MNPETGTSFHDILKLLRKGALIVILLGFAIGQSTYFLSRQIAPTYKATSVIVASQTSAADSRFDASLAIATPLDASAYAEAVKSPTVLADVLRSGSESEPDIYELDSLNKRISVSTENSRISSIIRITVESETAQEAADMANSVAQAVIVWDKARATEDLEVIIQTLESQISALDSEIRSLREVSLDDEELSSKLTIRGQQAQQLIYAQTLRTSAVGLLKLLTVALPPLEASSPRPIRNAVIAFILTILVSYGLILLRDSLNMNFKNSDELARVSGLPILAEFPELAIGSRRMPIEASSYLRTNLNLALPKNKSKTILVTSALGSEGKSSVALSLAESFARTNVKTLLVDADLRRSVLAKEYKLDENIYGAYDISEYLSKENKPNIPVVEIDNSFNLYIIPSFNKAENPGHLLGNMMDCLEQWRSQFDIIVIDSAPVLPVADTLGIAPLCTGTLFVTGFQTTDKSSVTKALDLLNRLNINILGIAVTQLLYTARADKKYGYGYGYDYGEKKAQRIEPQLEGK